MSLDYTLKLILFQGQNRLLRSWVGRMLSGWINNILAENLGTNSHVSENQIRPHSKMGLVSKSPIIGSLTEKICDRNVP